MRRISVKYIVIIILSITFCVIGLACLGVYFIYMSRDYASDSLLPSEDVCGHSEEIRVYGGHVAALDDFPWMAMIKYRSISEGEEQFMCGGTLINRRYILTAAHCVKDDIPVLKFWNLIGVRLGEYDLRNTTDCTFVGKLLCAPPPLDIPIEEVIVHEGFVTGDKNFYHDIALLRLAEEVPRYTEYVRPICLPRTKEQLAKSYVGTKLWIAGWGLTEQGIDSPVKLKLLVPVTNNTHCKTQFAKKSVRIRGGQICAGGVKGKDSCEGDSGGPLMTTIPYRTYFLNWYAIGLVSFGMPRCGTIDYPGVYTYIPDYMDWIISHLRS